MKYELSVIVPIYNMEKSLERCIESIFQQSYKDFELILVDDGSTDSSGEICDNLRDDRIKVIHKKNAGLPKARETGVGACTGDYICFIDADDWIDSNYLQEMYYTIKTGDVDMVCCGYCIEYNNTKRNFTKEVTNNCREDIDVYNCVRLLHTMESVYPYMWNKMFKRKLFDNVLFPDKHIMSEDYFILVQLLPMVKRIALIQGHLYHYVQSKESMCGSGFNKSYELAAYEYKERQAALLKLFPELEKTIIGYRIFQELAILASMTRNKKYDYDVISFLKKDIRNCLGIYFSNPQIALYHKLAAVLFCVYTKLFFVLYSITAKIFNTRAF